MVSFFKNVTPNLEDQKFKFKAKSNFAKLLSTESALLSWQQKVKKTVKTGKKLKNRGKISKSWFYSVWNLVFDNHRYLDK